MTLIILGAKRMNFRPGLWLTLGTWEAFLLCLTQVFSCAKNICDCLSDYVVVRVPAGVHLMGTTIGVVPQGQLSCDLKGVWLSRLSWASPSWRWAECLCAKAQH